MFKKEISIPAGQYFRFKEVFGEDITVEEMVSLKKMYEKSGLSNISEEELCLTTDDEFIVKNKLKSYINFKAFSIEGLDDFSKKNKKLIDITCLSFVSSFIFPVVKSLNQISVRALTGLESSQELLKALISNSTYSIQKYASYMKDVQHLDLSFIDSNVINVNTITFDKIFKLILVFIDSVSEIATEVFPVFTYLLIGIIALKYIFGEIINSDSF